MLTDRQAETLCMLGLLAALWSLGAGKSHLGLLVSSGHMPGAG